MKPIKSILTVFTTICVIAAGFGGVHAAPGAYDPMLLYGVPEPLVNDAPAVDVAPEQADAAILARLIERIESDTGVSVSANGDSAETGTATDAVSGDTGAAIIAAVTPVPSPAPSASATPSPAATAATTVAAEMTTDPASAGGGETGVDASDGAAAGVNLVEVTNPYGDETVYKDSYSICGVRDDGADPDEPIAVYLTRYDPESGGYIGFADVEGEYCWTVGSNGVFTRSVLLADGENHFALAACRASAVDAALSGAGYIEDSDIQVVKFTITYRTQNVAEKIVEATKELSVANILKEIENQ